MTWAKLDDSFHSHPKVRAAWNQSTTSIGLHMLAIAFAAAYETDGKVPTWFVEGVLPKARDRQSAIDALLETGMWSENGAGYAIHDFLDYNPSKAKLEDKRSKDSARKREERA